jgi:LacI family transcriptional regulator
MRVPADVSVVGYDDLNAHLAVPPMTVVSAELRELGRRAGQRALQLAGDRDAPSSARIQRVPSRLVIRESTAPLRRIP